MPSRVHTTSLSMTSGRTLSDFIAYDLPTKRWMKFIAPKVRIRVRGRRGDSISSAVKVGNRRLDTEKDGSSIVTHWPWNVDGRFPRPSFTDGEIFEIVIERRFLLGYERIQRTKSVTIDQVHTSRCEPCALSLYDGNYPARHLEGKVEIGKITFMLS